MSLTSNRNPPRKENRYLPAISKVDSSEICADSGDPIKKPRKSSSKLHHGYRVAHNSSPSPLPPLLLSTTSKSIFAARLLMAWPLCIHFLGFVIIVVALLYCLDGRRFYLERQPRVRLADGTYRSQRLGELHLLQSEVTTILSVLLMVLRWVATAWAVPLCWRAIFVLAGNSGLQYRDITWMINYGIFYPSTHFQGPLHLLLGLILISTLAPLPSAPLLTGSISWSPSNQTIDLPDHPTIEIAGFPSDNHVQSVNYYPERLINVATYVVKNFNTAWSQATDEFVFKRVVSVAAHLSTESTIDSMLLPYFVVTQIEWLPKLDTQSYTLLGMMASADDRVASWMNSPGGATIIFNATDPPVYTQAIA